jgi:hypothetical protein
MVPTVGIVARDGWLMNGWFCKSPDQSLIGNYPVVGVPDPKTGRDTVMVDRDSTI